MLGTPPLEINGLLYYVIVRGIERRPIFVDDRVVTSILRSTKGACLIYENTGCYHSGGGKLRLSHIIKRAVNLTALFYDVTCLALCRYEATLQIRRGYKNESSSFFSFLKKF